MLQEKAILERLSALRLRRNGRTRHRPDQEPPDRPISRIADVAQDTRATGSQRLNPDKEARAKLFTKHCAACHKIGNVGGRSRRNSTASAFARPERLLEDILDPNRNVDAAFRARSITLKTEKTLTAAHAACGREVLVAADLEGKEQRIPLKDIDENRETMRSRDASNFADVIPEADLYHILAYLLDQKPKKQG